MQVHDRFVKALYRTTQRSDELTQSCVNRMGVAIHELLQQSSWTVEDKKRVSSMVVGDPMTPESVESYETAFYQGACWPAWRQKADLPSELR